MRMPWVGSNERDVPEHMMVEGFRWSIGLVARLLMRIITEGSTAVMQAIYQDSAKLLRHALMEAPRGTRNSLQLNVRVGSQSISPLYWALRSGCHTAARTMIQDVLTIRADRDRYYYGVNDMFRFQPDIAANILQEAPKLVNVFLDGLIWRSHKTKDGLRPVVYYMEHLLQDTDEEMMVSRALVSFFGKIMARSRNSLTFCEYQTGGELRLHFHDDSRERSSFWLAWYKVGDLTCPERSRLTAHCCAVVRTRCLDQIYACMYNMMQPLG
ncbi:unnamed protein product [Durusdinium trenchii]|uniref:Uncharacterized protein n=1 Tax=Durusdinium trenchii TaxID=1381693 RepID=A0ABP0NMP4_9DINO